MALFTLDLDFTKKRVTLFKDLESAGTLSIIDADGFESAPPQEEARHTGNINPAGIFEKAIAILLSSTGIHPDDISRITTDSSSLRVVPGIARAKLFNIAEISEAEKRLITAARGEMRTTSTLKETQIFKKRKNRYGVLYLFSDTRGGPFQVFSWTAPSLLELGVSPIVIAGRLENEPEYEENPWPVYRLDIKKEFSQTEWEDGFTVWRKFEEISARKIASLLTDGKIQLIDIQTHLGMGALFAKIFTKIPCVYTNHMTMKTSESFSGRLEPEYRFYSRSVLEGLFDFIRKEYMLITEADAVIAVSRFIHTETLLEFPLDASKVIFIPNCIDPSGITADNISSSEVMEKWRKIENISPPAPGYFLFVGTLSRIKGADLLVRIIPELLSIKPDARFIFVGPEWEAHGVIDSFREYLGKACSSVIFTGEIKDRALLSWLYRNARAVVIPSRYEASSLVALEASLLGKKIISSRSGGLVETAGGPDVHFFNVDSPGKLLELLLESMDEPFPPPVNSVCDITSTENRMSEYFNPSLRARRLVSIYDSILFARENFIR